MQVALCALAMLAACGDGRRDEAAEGGTSRVAGNGDRVVVKTARGSAVIATGEDALALPTGLPLFPGAKIGMRTAVTEGQGEGGAATLLSFTSAADPAAIAAFYHQAALRAGYRIDADATAGAMRMLSATREGAGGFTLTVLPAAGGGSEATLIGGRE